MILRALFLQPLGPALVLAAGALLLRFLQRLALRTIWLGSLPNDNPARSGRLAYLASNLRVPMALVIPALGALVLLLLRFPDARRTLAWTWQPLTVAGSTVTWTLDGWNWLASLLILLLTGASLAFGNADDENGAAAQGDVVGWVQRTGNIERSLWLAAAALAFVTSGNLVTLASCWVVLDVALALRLPRAGNSLIGGRAWAVLSTGGFLMLVIAWLLGEDNIRAELAAGHFSSLPLGLLWVAALLRAGVYPLHLWLMGGGKIGEGDRLALHLVAPTAGLWMIGRAVAAGGPAWLSTTHWSAIGALALVGTSLAAWTSEDETWRWRWIAVNRASLVAMSAYLLRETGSALGGAYTLAWSLVSFALGAALLALGRHTIHRLGWHFPAILGALTLWGAPGTTGFPARSALVFPTGLALAVPLFGIVLVAEVLLAAALWQATVAQREDKSRQGLTGTEVIRFSLAVGMLAAPVLAWGLFPRQLAGFTGVARPEDVPSLFGMIGEARRSVWAGLAISGALGATLGVFRARIFAGMRGWQEAIIGIVSLDWLYAAFGGAYALFASSVQFFARLGEGEGYLGWLGLAILVLWVLIRG